MISRLLGVGLATLTVAAAPARASSCLPADAGVPMQSTTPQPYAAALRTDPATVSVGKPFIVELQVCAGDGARIERLVIDATMPAHRHGMNYKPELVALGAGRHEGRGFLFHMPGRWEFQLSVYGAATPAVLKLGVDVK
jgi:hypothetical protein